MHIEVAGGGHRGVTTMMAVGNGESFRPEDHKWHQIAVYVSTGLWGYAELTKRKKLSAFAFGATMASWFLDLVNR